MTAPSKSALILIEYVNDWLSPTGGIYPAFQDRKQVDNAIANSKIILEVARRRGLHVIHAAPGFRCATRTTSATTPMSSTTRWLTLGQQYLHLAGQVRRRRRHDLAGRLCTRRRALASKVSGARNHPLRPLRYALRRSKGNGAGYSRSRYEPKRLSACVPPIHLERIRTDIHRSDTLSCCNFYAQRGKVRSRHIGALIALRQHILPQRGVPGARVRRHLSASTHRFPSETPRF